jgi:hypothetical protein
MHCLPPEVIAHIFVLGLPALSLGDCTAVRRHHILLGSICSLWRQISHATPLLWTAVLFMRTKLDIPSDDMLRTSLARTAAMELEILVQYPPHPHCFSLTTASLLTLALPRARRLIIHMGDCAQSRFSILPLRNTPRLRELVLSGANIENRTTFVEADDTPLQSFEYMVHIAPKYKSIPTTHLISFESWAPTYSHDIEPFLDTCQRLESLKLTSACADVFGMRMPSSLKTLELWHHNGGPSSWRPFILSSNLIHITIRINNIYIHVYPARLATSQADHFPVLSSLRTLTFFANGQWAEDVKNILSRAPNLEGLEANMSIGAPLVTYLEAVGGVREPRYPFPGTSLRLLRIVHKPFPLDGAAVQPSLVRVQRVLQQQPDLTMEWYTQHCHNDLNETVHTMLPDRLSIIQLPAHSLPSPPLSAMY